MRRSAALQKKETGLDVVGWFLGGQKSTRAFLSPPPRETPKNDKKIERKIGFCRFFGKNLSIFVLSASCPQPLAFLGS
jgi:hypothetical protein